MDTKYKSKGKAEQLPSLLFIFSGICFVFLNCTTPITICSSFLLFLTIVYMNWKKSKADYGYNHITEACIYVLSFLFCRYYAYLFLNSWLSWFESERLMSILGKIGIDNVLGAKLLYFVSFAGALLSVYYIRCIIRYLMAFFINDISYDKTVIFITGLSLIGVVYSKTFMLIKMGNFVRAFWLVSFVGSIFFLLQRRYGVIKTRHITSQRLSIMIACAILGTGCLLFSQNCDISFLHIGTSGTDSGVFRYVAYAASKGEAIYRDIFDHKGPLLYLINYMGFIMHAKLGVYILEIITLLTAVYYMYRIGCKYNGRILSALTALLALTALSSYFEGGNLVEEYAIPFIAASIYIFYEYFIENKISAQRLFICGVCGGCVLMLRPNMAATWLVFPIFAFVREVYSKQYKKLCILIAWFVLGVIIAIAPFLVYFVSKGILNDFYNAYIKFNMMYSRADTADRINTMISFAGNPFYCISVLSLLGQLIKKRNIMWNVSYLLYEVVTLATISMSGMDLSHYGMILVPIYAYPIAIIASEVWQNKVLQEEIGKLAPVLSAFLFASMLLSFNRPIYFTEKDFERLSQQGTNVAVETNLDEVTRYIKENTLPEDRILVIGNENNIYLESERLSISKYSYQVPIINVSKEVYDEFYEDIDKNEAALVITDTVYEDFINIDDYLSEHQYISVYKNERYTIYQQRNHR